MVPASLRVQLLKAKEAAEAANHANDEFLANLNHEVRTVLNNVIGMTDSVLCKNFYTAKSHSAR